MYSSDGGRARFVIRAEGMRAPFAGPVYIWERGQQSAWPMFARFLRGARAAGRPSEVFTGSMERKTKPMIGGAPSGAAAAVLSGLSSDSSSDMLRATAALAPSDGREETP